MTSPHRCKILGILNVTTDSFSDGGRFLAPRAAIERGLRLVGEGADVIDVGGESTRPGARRVDAETELTRVVPVVRGLVSSGVRVSVDTMRSRVADAALRAGASIVNDVSGGMADPQMAAVVASFDCQWVLMHWRAHSQHMFEHAVYQDVVAEVRRELAERVAEAVSAGVGAHRLIVDPGLGFSKYPAHNWSLLAALGQLCSSLEPVPLLVGASRKSFLGALLASADGTPRPAVERDHATAAISLLAAHAGAWGVRVHDVRATVDALLVLRAVHDAAKAGTDG